MTPLSTLLLSFETTAGWLVGWMYGWMDVWMYGWMDGWMDRWMDRWMDGWMDGLDGCTSDSNLVCTTFHHSMLAHPPPSILFPMLYVLVC